MVSDPRSSTILSRRVRLSLFEKTTPSWILLARGTAKTLSKAPARMATACREWPMM